MDARIGILLRIIEERGGMLPLSSEQIGGLLGLGEARVLRLFSAEVGRTLPSWPQLGGAAALSGVAIAYAAKKIILGQYLKEGRTLISLNEKLTKVSAQEQAKLDMFIKLMED